MYGGGEEYFQEPESIDRDTLIKFSVLCSNLRSLEKPTKKAIEHLVELSKNVGSKLICYELVIGAIFRHIKSWKGVKQLCYWYVLDKLAKEHQDTYGFIAGKYILEVGRDYIPFEDSSLAKRYERLLEHWDKVFPNYIIEGLWNSKSERLWALNNPEEVFLREKEELETWDREEQLMEDEAGLDDYGEPCMEYLKGKCSWGSSCRLLHPPGLEGTMPPECRLGDWKCTGCGVINRHFRRRCSNCVREKPQFRRFKPISPEEVALTKPDPLVLTTLRSQFGYDPNQLTEVMDFWKCRFQKTSLELYLSERKMAYRIRILGKPPLSSSEEEVAMHINFPNAVFYNDLEDMLNKENMEGAKRRRTEPLEASSPKDAVLLFSQRIIECGVRDPRVALYCKKLSQAIIETGVESTNILEAESSLLLQACRMLCTFWNVERQSAAFVRNFFMEINKGISLLKLNESDMKQLKLLVLSTIE